MSEANEYGGFVPQYPAFHQPFWDSVARHQIQLQRCDGCGAFRFIPMEICSRCYSAASQWADITGQGEIYTYTIVHRAPTPAYQAEAPYALAYVTLDEGPRMMSRVVGCELRDVAVGLRVELTYAEMAPGLTLYHFRPAS